MNDDKIRRLISLVEPILEWNKDNPPINADVFNKGIIAQGLIIEIKEELSKKDPNSSKKFKQSKLFK